MFLYITSQYGTIMLNVSNIQIIREYEGAIFVDMQNGDCVKVVENKKEFMNNVACMLDNKVGKEVGLFEVRSFEFIPKEV